MPPLTIPHGPRTELRVEPVTVRGIVMLDLRVWEQARSAGGPMAPTRSGFLLKLNRINELQDALARAVVPHPTEPDK